MTTELLIGSRIKHIDNGHVFEIVSFQGYMNYNTGIERVDVENPDTEYIKNEDIGVVYKLI